MKFSLLNRLYKALPNGTLGPTVLGASYITDATGEIIGHMDMDSGAIFLANRYKHKDALSDRFNEQGLKCEFKDYQELNNTK